MCESFILQLFDNQDNIFWRLQQWPVRSETWHEHLAYNTFKLSVWLNIRSVPLVMMWYRALASSWMCGSGRGVCIAMYCRLACSTLAVLAVNCSAALRGLYGSGPKWIDNPNHCTGQIKMCHRPDLSRGSCVWHMWHRRSTACLALSVPNPHPCASLACPLGPLSFPDLCLERAPCIALLPLSSSCYWNWSQRAIVKHCPKDLRKNSGLSLQYFAIANLQRLTFW